CIPSSTLQTFRMMRPVNHLAVSLVMPTTPLDVGLVGAGLAGKATKVPAALGEMATAAVKGGSKLISRFAPYVTKPTGSTNLSALDLAAPKKAVAPKKGVTFKTSVEPSVRSPAASSVKVAPAADGAPKSILRTAPAQKPTSSAKKASPSYGKSPSRPTCSSSSRSPQAPSTAPPSSSSSKPKGVHNPKTKKSLDYGNQKHREFDESLPKSLQKKGIRDEHGKLHFPDKHTEIVHELKPGTVTGVSKGLKQLKRYEEVSGKPGLFHVYAPEGKPIDLDAIVQKNFRGDPVVQKILENLKQ
ncbi:MAG: hypothetical protein K2X02_08320, partial [Alphaproteobacteria bacterium]|nr:hypothetical protein [Alphaproteobacteria bacterium]